MTSFERWLQRVTEAAHRDSQTTATRVGPVQFTDIGTGPIILHSHGSPAGCDVGRLMFDDLLSQGFRVITPSRPGFLKTPLEVGPTIEAQADMFAALLDALHIDHVVMHAWSAGGPPGVLFAHKYPDRCRGYVHFCAVGHRWDHRVTWFERALLTDRAVYWLSRIAARWPEWMRRKYAHELGLEYDFIRADPTRAAVLDQFLTLVSPASLRNPGSFNDMANYRALQDLPYEAIDRPTLVVFCHRDRQLPKSNGDVAATRIPRAEYLELDYGGHMPQIGRQHELVTSTVSRFVRDCWSDQR
ncbi:MAG: alpha/beta hydrolase [Myxococcales bacterium FL481]|nr:MAG: alpha/beta hydrolase [Myxococcales bacterium FL481]